jgi:hypothetical protein
MNLKKAEKLLKGEDTTETLKAWVNARHLATVYPDDTIEIRYAQGMGDRMVLAFQADLTRVCTFMFANEGQNRAFTEVGVTDGHHDVSHHGVDPEKLRKKLLIDQFHLEQLAYILERLDSVKENGQSLLDSMALVYGAGISDGDRHNHDQLPILLAGKAGGRLKGGQHMVVTPRTPLNNLYMNLLDWNGGRMENFGDATGTLQGLF